MRPCPQGAAMLAAMLALAACGSSRAGGDVSAMDCRELDRTVGDTAKEISDAGVTRGRVDSYNLPSWLPGASGAQQRLVDRQTRRIDDLRQTQDRAAAERERRCPSLLREQG